MPIQPTPANHPTIQPQPTIQPTPTINQPTNHPKRWGAELGRYNCEWRYWGEGRKGVVRHGAFHDRKDDPEYTKSI